jgi:hypothetical protein
MPEKQTLAKIVRADIGFEDHGLFGFNIEFALGSSVHQGTGWYFLSNEHGGPFIEAIMNAVGVTRWREMDGKTVYVLHEEDEGYNSLIKGIEKLPTETRGGRLVFDEFFQEHGIKR